MDFWQRLTENCISCGFCTYGCPTCHCFNIHDEMRGDREGERLRSWDACMFHLYTQETSGHNPRPTLAHRYRNRINHKFSYYPGEPGRDPLHRLRPLHPRLPRRTSISAMSCGQR